MNNFLSTSLIKFTKIAAALSYSFYNEYSKITLGLNK
jgi:hypothetical protein